MGMRKFGIALVSALAVAVSAVAQPRFVVDTPIQKIGEMVFQSPKKVVFTFSNKGKAPLVIKEVHPSCGCIEVSYPDEPVPAGGKGTITANYDASMMGTFHRELVVYTNTQDTPYYLAFEGRVVERMLDYEGDFPIDLGNIRLNTNNVEFDNVSRGDRPVAELLIANTEHGAYTPQLMHLPAYLSAEYLPREIQGGRVGKIRLTLNSDKLFMDGLNQTSLYLARYLGDKVSDKNEIVVSTVLLPPFRDMTADELARAPRIVLMDGEDMVDGEVAMVMEKKKKATKTINVTNIGEDTLTISAVQVFNRALTVTLADRNILPHGTTKLKITVDAKELAKAKSGPRLLIISNDPRHAKTELNLNVE